MQNHKNNAGQTRSAVRLGVMLAAAVGLGTGAFARVSDVAQAPTEPGCKCWWFDHFEGLKERMRKHDYRIAFLGDSITHYWTDKTRGGKVWAANFASGEYEAINCGICGDRTEHVLWRLEHGLFDTCKPKAIVLMIGTNNTSHHHPWEADQAPMDTIAGVRAVVLKLKEVCPEAKIILHPIFPHGEKLDDPHRVNDDVVNAMIRNLADGRQVAWCDFNSRLVTADGRGIEKLMPGDFWHLGTPGYEIWAEEVKPYLDWALGKADKVPAAKNPPAPSSLPPNTNAAPVNALGCYGWFNDGRYQQKRAEVFANPSRWFDLVMIGDSITHNWESNGREVWARRFAGLKVLDLGFSGDKVQDLIWDCSQGGLIDGFACGTVTLMLGTNNTGDKPEDVAEGLRKLVGIIRARQPQAKLLLHPIFPRGEKPDAALRVKNKRTNALIRKLADGKDVIWVDFNAKLVNADGTISKDMMPDFLHPVAAGYEIWADALAPHVNGIGK